MVGPIVQCCQRQQKYITQLGHAKKSCGQPSRMPLPAALPSLSRGIKPDMSPFLPDWKLCQQRICVGFCEHLEGGAGPSWGSDSPPWVPGGYVWVSTWRPFPWDRVCVQCGNTRCRLLHLFGLCTSGREIVHLSFTLGQTLAITPGLPIGEDRLPLLSLPLLPMNQSPV